MYRNRYYRDRLSNNVLVMKSMVIVIVALNLMFSGITSALKESLRTKHVRHYEPVLYDHNALLHQHHVTKRSTSGYIDFRFEAYGKEFSTRLSHDQTVLHPEIVVETSHEKLPYDVMRVYRGYLEGEASSIVGVITKEGHFEGKLHTRNDTLFIERVEHVIGEPHDFHSVIYKLSDVTFNTSMTSCAHEKLRQRQRDLVREDTDPVFSTSSDYINDQSWYNRYMEERNTNQESTKAHGNTLNKNLKYRTRRAVDPMKVTCDLYMQADHLFYQKYGSDEDVVIEKLTQYVQALNSIYNSIDFDDDGSPDNIGFIIRKIKIYTDPTKPGYKYGGSMDVTNFLDTHSEDDYDDFCLSYLFTYRDFSDGILGLAWVGDVTDAGGVCQEHNVFKGVGKSLNSGIITILNYGSDMPSAVTHVTFAHEVGHNFGATHDEDGGGCTPGDPQGNYIMYAHATSGTKPNNHKFSKCSTSKILPVINKKGRSADGCFLAPLQSICGNKVVEDGEECDCGWEEDCVEGCCNPQVYNTTGKPTPCTTKSTSVCSPSQGLCCDNSCQFRPTTYECRAELDCLSPAYCNGSSAVCPASDQVNDTTPCGNAADYLVCKDGECSGSVCLAYGRAPCQCVGTSSDNWNEDILCHVCCLDGGVCKSSFDLTDMPNAKAVSGSPCNDYGGYCDVSKKCVHVDNSGPLSNLEKLLFSSETFNTVKDWLMKHWYVGVAAGVGLIILIGLLVKCCMKSSSNKAMKKAMKASKMQGQVQRRYKQNQVKPDRWK